MKTFKSFFLIFSLLALNISFTGAYFSSTVSISGNIFETEVVEPPAPARIVINEVYYHPDEVHGGYRAEWIELYNAGGSVIDIKNWYFKNHSSGKEKIEQSYDLQPGQFLLIAANANTWQQNWDIIPNNASKIALGGQLLFDGLVNGGDSLSLYDRDENLIDGLSWGSDSTVLNPSIPTTQAGHSFERKTVGLDTDTALDFVDRVNPTPGL